MDPLGVMPVFLQMTDGMSCQSGAVIYYADGGETLWDIAKRFKVSSDMLGSGEPDAVVPKGERLIFIRK